MVTMPYLLTSKIENRGPIALASYLLVKKRIFKIGSPWGEIYGNKYKNMQAS